MIFLELHDNKIFKVFHTHVQKILVSPRLFLCFCLLFCLRSSVPAVAFVYYEQVILLLMMMLTTTTSTTTMMMMIL